METICTFNLSWAKIGDKFCRCGKCPGIADHIDALRWYREDWGPGPSYYEPFPEKEEK